MEQSGFCSAAVWCNHPPLDHAECAINFNMSHTLKSVATYQLVELGIVDPRVPDTVNLELRGENSIACHIVLHYIAQCC